MYHIIIRLCLWQGVFEVELHDRALSNSREAWCLFFTSAHSKDGLSMKLTAIIYIRDSEVATSLSALILIWISLVENEVIECARRSIAA